MRSDLLPARYRIGMLIPSSNTTIEREYYSIMPRDFSFHFDRLSMTALTDEGIKAQAVEVAGASRRLADARMNLMLLCQTAASFWLGGHWDSKTRSAMEEAAGAAALTAAGTLISALRAMSTLRVSIAAPFPKEVGERTIQYMHSNQLEVVASSFLGIRENARIADIPPSAVMELVHAADHRDAQAVVIPGGNMPCMALLDRLEFELGKPVVTTNQAGMWAILSHFRWQGSISECGILLKRMPHCI
ncbi:MAG: hypothetical protein IT557_06300 [Alphaproteobacteria bacterium]|nr:hypothetical protein [Alphaproteobacteria bacterium]